MKTVPDYTRNASNRDTVSQKTSTGVSLYVMQTMSTAK